MIFDEKDKKDIFRLTVEGMAEANLAESGRWAKFLAILGFIYLGVMSVTAALSILSMSNGVIPGMPPGISAWGAVIPITLFLGISVYPTYSLYKFGRLIKPSIVSANTVEFTRAVGYLKKFFKYIGILWICFLGIMALGLVFMLIGALGSLI